MNSTETAVERRRNPQPVQRPRIARQGKTLSKELPTSIGEGVKRGNGKRNEHAAPLVRLPGATPVGKVYLEEGIRVWERRVTARHILRMSDSFTINEPILRQLRNFRVVLIRYVAPEGTYELDLDAFTAMSKRHRFPSMDEDVLAVPRTVWRFRPRFDGSGLFAFTGKA